jgi:histidine ammonia-lyase
VSMAWGAARKLRKVVENLARILAVELIIAARAIELRAPLEPSSATSAVIAAVRESIPGFGPDRYLSPDLRAGERLVRSGAIREAAAAVVAFA